MVTVPMHMGALHPLEQGLVLLLAFGPFIVLALAVVIRHRSGRDDEQADPGDS